MSRPSPTSPEVAAAGLATAAVGPTEETLSEPTPLPQLPKETWRWKLSPQGHSANLYPHRYVRKYLYFVNYSVSTRRLSMDIFGCSLAYLYGRRPHTKRIVVEHF